MKSLDVELRWHFTYNLDPTVDPLYIPAARRAIRFVNNGMPNEPVELPNKVCVTANRIVEELYLHDFLYQEF